MDKYVVDAVAFLAYLADALPAASDEIFKSAERGEVSLILPSIVLGEVLYTIYRGREVFGARIPEEKIDFIFRTLRHSGVFQLLDLPLEGWELFLGSSIPEMHDRMIVATATLNEARAIITTDPEIAGEFPTIWTRGPVTGGASATGGSG
ncbi:MAG: type II toxin-antitoxin system VapC family toxin [Promethearchaeota archaeon]